MTQSFFFEENEEFVRPLTDCIEDTWIAVDRLDEKNSPSTNIRFRIMESVITIRRFIQKQITILKVVGIFSSLSASFKKNEI